MADSPDSMRIFENRLASFERSDHPSKKHQSSQGKGAARKWTHETPTAAELASAGFYFDPLGKSADNCACFMCKVNLGGWEIDDVPLKEHLAHSATCPWAISRSVTLDNEDRDPLSEKLLNARKATFEGWPHESKKGWKCKAKKMAESGWCMDMGNEADDGATCFYCNTAIDCWERQDDPQKEHHKRRPDCLFFTLVDRYASQRPKKGRGRASNASKASRLSTQSVISTFSEAPSLMSLGEPVTALEGDTSIGTITSTTSTTKGKRKAPAGKGRGRKKPVREPSLDETEAATALTHLDESVAPSQSVFQSTYEEPATVSATDVEITSQEGPTKKTARGRAKGKKVTAKQDTQAEEQSNVHTELAATVTETEPSKPPPRAKRGKKRTSDGEVKPESQQPETMSQMIDEAPSKPKRGRPAKGKKAKPVAEESQVELETQAMDMDATEPAPAPDIAAEPVKPKRGRKPKVSKQTKAPSPEPELEDEQLPDLKLDDFPEPPTAVAPIEQGSADAIEVEDDEESGNYEVHDESSGNIVVHDHTASIDGEHEPTPTPQKPRPSRGKAVPQPPAESAASTPRSTRSHQSSDAENHPPSSATQSQTQGSAGLVKASAPSPPARALSRPPPQQLSPTKTTTRVPLAAQTPNRSPLRSPHKLGVLKSSTPWSATDMEAILFPDGTQVGGQENARPATEGAGAGVVAEKLVALGGQLTSPERKMTVEEWIRFQAVQGEVKLKDECERLVSLFEREGQRAMGVLGGVQVGV